MTASTKIEWTDVTWNPVVGCTRVSSGCDNCYAVRMAHRLEEMGHADYEGLTVLNGKGDRHFSGTVRCLPKRLEDPFHWRKPRKIFVNSMSDLFHEDVPDEFIDQVFAVMERCSQHTFQVLTKRPERMAEYFSRTESLFRSLRRAAVSDLAERYGEDVYDAWLTGCGANLPLPNVWLGVSCENQATADERIPYLLQCPAAVRFLSLEPLLGGIDLKPYLGFPCDYCFGKRLPDLSVDACPYCEGTGQARGYMHGQMLPGTIGWVIVGGESGPGARPMHPNWVRKIRDDCTAAGVPFFFKQWGAFKIAGAEEQYGPGCVSIDESGFTDECHPGMTCYANESHGIVMKRVPKKKAGRALDGRTHDAMLEVVA